MRERWGTLSVKDHVSDAPLVTEVLLFDRLVVPTPVWYDETSIQRWESQGWKPEELQKCLDIVGEKTAITDGLAMTVPWGQDKEERFNNAMSVAAALSTQERNPIATYYNDPFEMTRALIRDEFLPALPHGVSKAWTVANYASTKAFRKAIPKNPVGGKPQFALSLAHHFLTPIGKDVNHDMLKRAVDLATSDDFRRKRRAFYSWQETIIEENIRDEKAIEEMEGLLKAYNESTRKAFNDAIIKYVFTIIPIGFALLGAGLDGSEHARVIAGAVGIAELIRFWTFDRKLDIASGDLDGAAMIHDARKVLPLRADEDSQEQDDEG